MGSPDVTMRSAERMTAEDWRAERAERQRKDRLYDMLEVRLAFRNAHPHANCQGCFKRFRVSEMSDGLCPMCGAWAAAAVKRLQDREASRKLKVQLAACDMLMMLNQTQRGSMSLRSDRLHRISLLPFEEARWAARA